MKFRRTIALLRDVPAARLELRLILAIAFGVAWIFCGGCGNEQFRAASSSASPSLSGTVHGGQQPISGATIQLYAVGNTGDQSASIPLLSQSVLSNSNGDFGLTGLYTCPSPSTDVYLTATGGNPGLQSGATNSNLSLMVALGPCGNLTASSYSQISELSTVAVVYELAPYMRSFKSVGSGPLDAQLLASAFSTAGEMVNVSNAAIPGSGLPQGQTVPAQKIRALADILSTCINSPGGVAGDGSPCGSLFALATPPSGSPPTDTVTALLNIANNPTAEVVPIYLLAPPVAPFQPTLTSAPSDWTLNITSPTPAPAFYPAPGTYTSSPWITLSDSNAAARIYYTTDGSTPATSSRLYSGAISLSATGMIRAIAVAAGITSLPVAGTYTLVTPTIALAPSSVSLTQSGSQQFSATVSGVANSAVTWSLSPAVGTISTAGVYSAPVSIASHQTVTVTAASVADASVTAMSDITLNPPVNVAISPGSVSLTVSQTQAFSATVANAPNPSVNWSISPAIGSISTVGLYTAPASITSAQIVTVTAASAANSAATASTFVSLALSGATYYLSASGSDRNNGKSPSSPWLSMHHNVNCGDTVIAAPSSSYNGWNFDFNWGSVTCAGRNNVAWLKCATFDGCKIIENSTGAVAVDQSFWGVQGFEVQASPGSQDVGCFSVRPNYANPVEVHHVIFANDIANGCQAGGFTTANNGTTASVDYVAFIGNIAYNASQDGRDCTSGFSVYQPIQADFLPGTHIYVAGNFAYGNIDANPCAGGRPTDGEGIIFDTFDGDQGGLPSAYAGQTVADNNMLLANGGRGLQVGNNISGSGPFASIHLRHNTMWGNNRDQNQNTNTTCAEESLYYTANTEASLELAVTNTAKSCGGNSLYSFYTYLGNGTDEISRSWGYAASGTNSGSVSSTGFTFGPSDILGTNPGFANPVAPGAPNCSGFSSVPSCMSTVIANFTPTNAATGGYGYQVPGVKPVYDPLFPQWLCNVNLPPGLVSMGCLTTP